MPCCGFITLTERSAYEICPVCFWEDDGQDDHDADHVRGGPNGRSPLRPRGPISGPWARAMSVALSSRVPHSHRASRIIKPLTRVNGIPVIRASHEAATCDPVTGRWIDTAAEYSNGP